MTNLTTIEPANDIDRAWQPSRLVVRHCEGEWTVRTFLRRSRWRDALKRRGLSRWDARASPRTRSVL